MVVAGVDERHGSRAVPRRPLARRRNTWLVRVAGLSAGSLAVGLVIGLLLPR
ncbi:hypothetical protein [Parafrankia discariae]|uniref:hypothetical protein n=1 Tax=Parafrankia discariae TaxID=365528 RepID=UPI0003788209|nr:hypothetical protein [Parafrankia discariae]